MTATELYYDPYDYSIDDDPYPVWARLRDEAPLYHNEKLGFYALSRYDDVLDGPPRLRDVRVEPRHHHGDDQPGAARRPDDDHDGPAAAHPAAQAREPRVHADARRAARAAHPRRSAPTCSTRSPIETEFDFIHDFAGLLPPTVILALARLPRPTSPRSGARRSTPRSTSRRARPREGASDALRHRHREPHRRARLRGVRHAARPHRGSGARTRRTTCSRASCTRRSTTRRVSTARSPTTRSTRSSSCSPSPAARRSCACSASPPSPSNQFPDQREILVARARPRSRTRSRRRCASRRRRPSRAAGSPRTSSSTAPSCRAARRWRCSTARADRDQRHFPDADRYDVKREIDRHLAFGYGTHFCIGRRSPASRAASRSTSCSSATPRGTSTRPASSKIHTSTVRGYTSVPVITGLTLHGSDRWGPCRTSASVTSPASSPAPAPPSGSPPSGPR